MLPPDDEGPLSQDTCVDQPAAMDEQEHVAPRCGRKRKTAPLTAGPVQESAGQQTLELPPLPNDVEGDLPGDLLQDLVLDGPVQNPAGRPAVAQGSKRGGKRRNRLFEGRSMVEIMQVLEMVPTRQPGLWDVEPQILRSLDGSLPDDLMEIYSPPRMVPFATALGMRASLSVDILTGWNLLNVESRMALVQEIKQRRPRVLMMSPPCTWFSGLMNLNWGKIKPVLREQAFQDATLHLEFCMLLADLQESQGRGWAFEHPDTAKSWHNSKVKAVLQLGAFTARFDQCMFGLVSKVDKIPMRKRTRFMTNIKLLKDKFDHKFCDCSHDHVSVMGSEGGERRSVWAQRYPAKLCEVAVQSFHGYSLEHAVS